MAKIYCDMDGVLVDLLGSIKKHLGTTKLNQGVLDDFLIAMLERVRSSGLIVIENLVANSSGNTSNNMIPIYYLPVHLFVIKTRKSSRVKQCGVRRI